jgi:hypothetical protein
LFLRDGAIGFYFCRDRTELHPRLFPALQK